MNNTEIMFFWLFLFVIFIILEITTFNLVTIWFAIGALVALILSILGFSLTTQIVAFLVSSIIALIISKPLVKKLKNSIKQIEPTNVQAIIGKIGIANEDFDSDIKGYAKIDGMDWLCTTNNENIKKDDKVRVLSIRGTTLTVTKINN